MKGRVRTVPDDMSVNPLRWLILANVAVGTFMAVLDGGIANVGLPSISQTLHVGLTSVEWVVMAYLLTISATLPIIGKLSDGLGKSRVFGWGFLVFALGSAMCGFSPSIQFLIGARILQAFGAAFLMANSQGILAQTFSPQERGRAMGTVGTVVAVGGLAGPPIGGLLIGWFGWPSIFWVNVPIGIVGFVASLKIMPHAARRTLREPFDFAGSLLFMVAMVSLLFSVSRAETWGWTSAALIIGVSVAVLAFMAFSIRERLTPFPMLDFSLYRNRVFALGTTAGFLSFVAIFCVNIMIPFYLRNVLHLSPALTGYVMAANPVVMAVVAPVSGWLSDRIGPVILTTTGLSISGIGFVLLNFLSSHSSAWVVALHLAIFGLGQGMFQSPNNSAVMGAVPRNRLGIAGGLNALVRNVGMVFGISLSVSLFTHRMHSLTVTLARAGGGTAGETTAPDPAVFMGALHTVFWAAAIVCVMGIACSFARGGRPTEVSTQAG